MLSAQNLDRDAQMTSGETQLKLFGNLLSRHDDLLNGHLYKLTTEQTALFRSNSDRYQAETAAGLPTISLEYTPPCEGISAFQLIDSDNKILNKVLITFAKLCEEASKLKADGRIQQMKLLYFDEHLCTFEEQGETEECLLKMSALLELLNTIHHLSQRCIVVANAILQQLEALFSNKRIDSKLDLQLSMQFQEVFNRLGDVLLQLITFDEILVSSSFQNFWRTYKKAIHSILRNLNRFGPAYNEFEINGLASILNTLEIFSGNIFQTFLDGTFKIKERVSTKTLPDISGHFLEYIRVNLASIEKFSSVLSEFDETELIVKINGVAILFHNFFGQLDQKTLKHLMDLNSKNIGITLIGNIIWSPEQFLLKYAQTIMKGHEKYIQDQTRLRQSYIQTRVQTISSDAKQYSSMVLTWTLRMNWTLKLASPKLQTEHLKIVCSLLLQGIKYGGQISHTIKSLTNLHALLHMKMAKATLLSICKLMELLKIVQLTIQNHFNIIAESMQRVMQHLAFETLFIISAIKKKLTNQSSRNERNLDTLSALQIAEKCFYGPATKHRILIASLALNFANPMRVLTPEHMQQLHKHINRLDQLSSLQSNLECLTDPSFMYWHQSILTVYLKQILSTKSASSQTPGGYASIKYLMQSAEICSRNFEKHYTASKFGTIENFRMAYKTLFRQEIAVKLCAQIETFLRIHVHESLAQNKSNPLKEGLDDCRELINMSPMDINGHHVVLKDHVENYLSNMFYNLTTISLHDWRTYSEMRHLGNYKFDLVTIEDHLPTQQLEQGIDVLEIMRNIHVFVSKYLYNMNNQIFIECSSNNKHLNTIGIRHIANSLRTHGSGIINTTVNFTYQFLRKKLYTFSQFLYDEHIKSRLMKDLKYFRGNNKDKATTQFYSFERASNFNKGIKKFGLTPDGQSYLDLFRQLISQIGNAMGYIRLMRSGGIHASSNVSIYLPKFDDNLMFVKNATADGASSIAQKAAENLETNIGNLSRCFSDETEYFKVILFIDSNNLNSNLPELCYAWLLIMAFTPFFRDPKNIHLRNFYLIVPALTINFVEYIINAKDKIHKKDKHGVLFVDDGLAMGIVYLLRLLDQITEFNTLHWFKSVKQHYVNEHSKIIAQREQINAGNYGIGSGTTQTSDSKLQQTLALTEKRINAHQIEFNLLYYNLQSSKIFFQ